MNKLLLLFSFIFAFSLMADDPDKRPHKEEPTIVGKPQKGQTYVVFEFDSDGKLTNRKLEAEEDILVKRAYLYTDSEGITGWLMYQKINGKFRWTLLKPGYVLSGDKLGGDKERQFEVGKIDEPLKEREAKAREYPIYNDKFLIWNGHKWEPFAPNCGA